MASALFVPVLACASTTFDTTYAWDNSSSISPWGAPNTTVYGQSFVAPTDNKLVDFTFYVKADQGVSIQYQAKLYSWAGSLLGGGGGAATAEVATSSSATYTGDGTFQAITFYGNNLFLTPGSQYVLALSCADPTDYAATTGTSVWGLVSGHVSGNGGGGFVFDNAGNDPSLIIGTWDNFFDAGDLAWTAHFESVPEVNPTFVIAALAVVPLALRRFK
ncbi:MAG: hypothetical protein KF857_06960 [Fimbriimonadaceae bacterium]|nr:hypothetical protein [Fimbriimonadaceae bacterium]